METEDKYKHPDFQGLTKTGRKRPTFKKGTRAAIKRDKALRFAGAKYRQDLKITSLMGVSKSEAYKRYKRRCAEAWDEFNNTPDDDKPVD